MERYCAYRERCCKEVASRLSEMNMKPTASDKIIAHLINRDYLNEERFAKSFAWGKFSIKKWGKQRIIRELKMREIPADYIRMAINEISEEDYYHTFYALAEKRYAQIKGLHPLKQKKKLTDYLLYRGWESEMISEQVNALIK